MSPPHPHSNRAYFFNIAWSWLGLAAMLFSAAVIMPVLIRRLGTAQYGIWVLAVSLVEYFWLIDLGFRPATVKLSAEFRAVDRMSDLNRLINTALAYSLLAGSLVLLAAWPNVSWIARLLHIDHPAFGFLIRVVGVSWAAGLVFNVFAAVLEGFQRFDLSTRITIVVTLSRSTLSLALVLAGYGLREMGLVLLISQGAGYAMTYFFCRRVHPEMRLSPRFVSRHMAREILLYARQIISGVVGSRVAQAGVPSMIAYFKPVRFVTYFTQTQRMMEYAADLISRVALVTAPRVSDWFARGYRAQIVSLARSANRYCVTLWGLLAAYLFVYGGPLCRVWINPEFGDQAGVLLPWFLAGYTLWMGQFVSSAVLMGIGRYTRFSVTLFVEALAVIAGSALVLPRFGLTGAAAVYCACMIVSRCLILSRLFAREFELSQVHFLRDVFAGPLLLMGGSVAALWVCRQWFIAGRSWGELLEVGFPYALVYTALAFWRIVAPEHRSFVWGKAVALWRQPREALGL